MVIFLDTSSLARQIVLPRSRQRSLRANAAVKSNRYLFVWVIQSRVYIRKLEESKNGRYRPNHLRSGACAVWKRFYEVPLDCARLHARRNGKAIVWKIWLDQPSCIGCFATFGGSNYKSKRTNILDERWFIENTFWKTRTSNKFLVSNLLQKNYLLLHRQLYPLPRNIHFYNTHHYFLT